MPEPEKISTKVHEGYVIMWAKPNDPADAIPFLFEGVAPKLYRTEENAKKQWGNLRRKARITVTVELLE